MASLSPAEGPHRGQGWATDLAPDTPGVTQWIFSSLPAPGEGTSTASLPVLPLGTAQGQEELGRAGFGWCGTLRKDSIDFEARELLRNRVLGSPAKQERVHGLGNGSCSHGGHS